ncbi:hypothetical protein [Enterococcus sp. AZ072]|uniref:hypothetical protein n=1 Tax=unclassified Enterococcus TaxID=2608891 RepID=UPI003D2D941E
MKAFKIQGNSKKYKLTRTNNNGTITLPFDIKKRSGLKLDDGTDNVSTDRYLYTTKNIKSINSNSIDTIIDASIEQNLDAIKDLVDL